MDITLLIPSRSWWDYEGHFQLALTGYTLNIRMIDKEMTELWHLKVCRVSYSSVSCIRDQRVNNALSEVSIFGRQSNFCSFTYLFAITLRKIRLTDASLLALPNSLTCKRYIIDFANYCSFNMKVFLLQNIINHYEQEFGDFFLGQFLSYK